MFEKTGIIRTDLTERLTVETALFIEEKYTQAKVGSKNLCELCSFLR